MSNTPFVSASLVIAALILPFLCMAQDGAAPASMVALGSSFPPGPDAATYQTNGDRPTLQQRYPRYHVTRSDVLSLSFPLSPEFNRQVTVQPDGYINLQSTMSLHVQGMTLPEIVTALKKAYANVLRDPIVDIDVVDFQKPFFIVGGQVTRPGQYELRHDTTVTQGIAIAGGIGSGGKTQIFLFRRFSLELVEVKKLNLKDIYHGRNANEDAQLQPGDTIFVPEKFITIFRKYIPYSVGTSVNPQAAFAQ